MIFGYIRVSTEHQHTEQQKDEIMHYAESNNVVIDDFISITISSKKNLNERRIEELLDMTSEGDTVVVVELSRLGRSIIEVLQMVDTFTKRGVILKFTRQPFLDTGAENPFQKVIMSMFAAFAETERDLISIRTKAGLERARKKKKLGAPEGPRTSKFDRAEHKILKMINKGLSAEDVAKLMGVQGSSLRRWAKRRGIKLVSRKKQLLEENKEKFLEEGF